MLHVLRACLVAGSICIIHAIAFSPLTSAKLFNSPIDQLPVSERVSLKNGNSLVTGGQGKYTARVLVTASPNTAWDVLTDYVNLSKFVPNMISSQIISTNGNKKIVEQIDKRQVFVTTIKSRVRLAITETAKSRIDFQTIGGDSQGIESMVGYWKIEPVAPYSGAKSNQVLITQVVEVKPKSGTPKGIFYDVFKNSLDKTMKATKKEVSRRNQSVSLPGEKQG
ncbi:SRPBCC family protein [Calothrix sp. PCC 6303]|uniref:SRPBCC family protein n=1 Tax=Calothrix sp. PCC 6303 TaxID=1170562 RepID=UPI0002A043EE|nr:SRPBCC family protein [Calothrix sp. PCC 6303]AFZ04224.1 cyclase/dehydrase [Calothrix sp. PCC 6303]